MKLSYYVKVIYWLGKTLAEVAKTYKPGVTTKELDKVAEEFIRDNGATPTFKGFQINMEFLFQLHLYFCE
jgi:methionine aminopeptidase